MRGHNAVWISGNIGARIVKAQTKDKREACSFALASEGESGRTTWVRVNVYDRLAEYCKDKLRKGVYCTVVGELMNRDGQYGELTEVRAKEVIFFPSHDRDSHEREPESNKTESAE